MVKRRKALNFDFDTKLLQIYYPNKHYRQAYKDVKRFLKNNDFEWRQGSGYNSARAMSQLEVRRIAIALSQKFPWFIKCIKQFDVTDIGKDYSLVEFIKENSDERTIEIDIKNDTNKLYVDEIIQRANLTSNINNNEKIDRKQNHKNNLSNEHKEKERYQR